MELDVKTCLIRQKSGIGDICLLQKIAKKYINNGFKVIWPIVPELLFMRDHIKAQNLTFIDYREEFENKEIYNGFDFVVNESDFAFLPFDTADRYVNVHSVLEAKYALLGEDFRDWADHFSFERNLLKEEELFNKFELEGQKYTLINKKVGTQPNFREKDVYIEGNNRVIEIDFIEGFSPFDWCKILENADQISIVDTSFNYIMEKLDLKAEKLFLTSRFTPSDFSHIINLFKKPWKYIA